MNSLLRVLMTSALAAAAAGCAPWVTYPPVEGPIDPKVTVSEPVPQLMAETIAYAHARYGSGDDPAINLPAGSPPWLYDRVIRYVGKGHPMRDPGEPAYHITRVLVRGLKGEVDVFIPNADGTYSFATVTFRRDALSSYRHHRTRWWDTGDEPPPPSLASAPQG